MAIVAGADRGWLFCVVIMPPTKELITGQKNLNTNPMHGICTDQTTQKQGMKVRPAKQVPFCIVNYANKLGEAEGEPTLFVRIIPCIMYLDAGLHRQSWYVPNNLRRSYRER